MRFALPAFLLSVLAGAATSPAIGADAETPDQPLVLFSTDYGLGIIDEATNGPDRHAADVDDAYAISLATHAADVRAVASTFGNDKAQPSANSARRGLSALGIDDAAKIVSVGTGASATPSTDNDGAMYTYTGDVRGCSAFAASNGLETFEQAVADSIAAVISVSASSE